MVPGGTGERTGPRRGARAKWAACPEWPADVFAVAGTLIEHSDCYTCIGAGIGDSGGYAEQMAFNKEARRLGRIWADTLGVPAEVQVLWTALLQEGKAAIHHRNSAGNGSSENPPRLLDWERLALRLFAIADEAGRGFGWDYPSYPVAPARAESEWIASRYSTTAARFLVTEILESAEERRKPPNLQKPRFLRYLPNSICRLVPPELACVQPKSNTPQMGCTMRALSHHQALLPSIGVAESEWVNNFFHPRHRGGPQDDPGALNILVVPFPYEVHGNDFEAIAPADGNQDGLFTVRQGWLPEGTNPEAQVDAFKDFVVDLIEAAQQEVRRIDIVVFPELALTNQLAEGMARAIATHYREKSKKAGNGADLGPDMLICGTSGDNGNQNNALTLLLDNEQAWGLPQSKHHRWRIDGNQIKSYHLGHAFNPKRRYWEKIPLRERHLRFVVNRNHEVIATLVCEDLARNDPVMPLLNAVGPNLVVALLMDGPQLISRWPGRYATVLADDPGSAVLSVTSLGMVLRSQAPDRPMPGNNGRRSVAIWREPDQSARELDLPNGAHALVLAISSHPVRQVALDLRDDADMGFRLELSAVRPVSLTGQFPWLRRSGPSGH